ncbi:UNVERIFIED_CONTAM: hypothetical protein NCL1_16955 [Trichonephila clavipes]
MTLIGMMNAEEKSNICDRLSYFNEPHNTPALRIFHSFSGSHRNTRTRTNIRTGLYSMENT